LSRQKILDAISVYWFTASATSSARLYWESFGSFALEQPESLVEQVRGFFRLFR
jgi:hypothetical protein